MEQGIAARVLEYANGLLAKAYETTPVDYDGDGTTDWYEPVIGTDGEYSVLFDDTTEGAMDSGGSSHPEDCDGPEPENSEGCTCGMNRWCVELENYVSVLDWMASWSGFADFDTEDSGDMIGIW